MIETAHHIRETWELTLFRLDSTQVESSQQRDCGLAIHSWILLCMPKKSSHAWWLSNFAVAIAGNWFSSLYISFNLFLFCPLLYTLPICYWSKSMGDYLRVLKKKAYASWGGRRVVFWAALKPGKGGVVPGSRFSYGLFNSFGFAASPSPLLFHELNCLKSPKTF